MTAYTNGDSQRLTVLKFHNVRTQNPTITIPLAAATQSFQLFDWLCNNLESPSLLTEPRLQGLPEKD